MGVVRQGGLVTEDRDGADYGVAAGDVTDSSAILWTQANGVTNGMLEVAKDASFDQDHSYFLAAGAISGLTGGGPVTTLLYACGTR